MTKATKHIIALDITTLSPMHITAIEKGSYDLETQRVSRFKSSNSGIGCSLTRTLSMAHHAREKDSGLGLFTPLIPVIPSSTIGGKLRRAAADLIGNSLIDRSMKISPAAYNVMNSGMATTELKGEDKNAEVMIMARKDAFISLFGGTSFSLDSHTVIGEGLPLIKMTEGLLMSPPIADIRDFSGINEMTDVIAIIKKDDVQEMRRENLEALVGFQSIAEYLEKKGLETADSKKRKADKKDGKEPSDEKEKKTDIRTFNAFEAIKTGVDFGLRIEVTSFEPSHLGLMLLAVQSLLRDAQIGGKAAKGYGRFALTASRLYSVDPATRIKSTGVELFHGQDSGYAFIKSDSDDDLVSDALLAVEDYLDTISPELIEAFASADASALKKAYKAAEKNAQ